MYAEPELVRDAVTFEARHAINFCGGASPEPGRVLIAVQHGPSAVSLELNGIEGDNDETEIRAALTALDCVAGNTLRRPISGMDPP